MLAALDVERRKVIAIEGTEGFGGEGAVRLEVDPEGGLDPAEALRAALLMDLDVALVEAPATPEVAETAVGAALGGHLVILAVGARDAAGALTAVAAMVPDPAAFAEALVGAIAVRRLPRADATGTVAVHEFVAASPEIRGALRRGAEAAAVTGALPRSRRTLRAEAEKLAGEGRVSAADVERAFG
jgi:type II secretory ATPase GspE/PulE/Tfp pilus assembly ATPase PilB-like protein